MRSSSQKIVEREPASIAILRGLWLRTSIKSSSKQVPAGFRAACTRRLSDNNCFAVVLLLWVDLKYHAVVSDIEPIGVRSGSS